MNNILEKLNKNISNDFIQMQIEGMEKKDVTYIYAKNGIGKTTFSRQFYNQKNFYIYNSDFIANNVFIDKEDDGSVSTEQSPNSKKNTFSIFFGEKISILIENEKKISEQKENIKEIIENKINSGWLIEEKDFLSSLKITLPKINELKRKTVLEKISSDQIGIIKQKISSIKNLDLEQNAIDKFNKIIDLILIYNDSLKEINSIIKETPKEENDVIEIHKAASKLNRDFKFVDIEFTKENVDLYLEKIITKKSELVISSNEKLKLLFSAWTNFLNEYKKTENSNIKFLIDKISPLNIEQIKKANSLETNEYELIINIPEKVGNLNKDELLKYIKEKLDNPFSLLKEDISVEKDKYFLLDNKLDEVKKEKIKSLNSSSENVSKKINSLIKHFRIDGIEVNFKPENVSGKDGKATIEINTEKNLKTLSEGEKKIFALSYFIAFIEEKINEANDDIVVIIDDPFDSNDHSKSSYFKKIPFNFYGNEVLSLPKLKDEYMKKTNKKFKIIISTHNLNILYDLTSSLIIKEGSKKMFFSCKEKDSIEIREWIRSENNNLKIEEVFGQTRSFFPNENIIEFVIWNEFISSICDKDCEINKIRLLLHFLVRINDLRDFDKRNKIKNIISNKSFGDKYKIFEPDEMMTSLISACRVEDRKIIKNNEKIVLENLKKIQKSNIQTSEVEAYALKHFDKIIGYDFDNEEIEILNNYLIRYTRIINKAITTNDIQLLQRLRHRDYLSSTVAAFGLNEI